jgi:23S rRNA pseudouridine2605 synthase
MLERLQKIISQAGICSRRAAESLITSGRVTVNGVVTQELGTKADANQDIIKVDGRQIRPASNKIYILLYKPVGYVTTLDDPQGRPIVTDLVQGFSERLFPVGRLDYNTEGLLLLTNDGEWANRLAHPRHKVEKEYHVRIRGSVTAEQSEKLAAGVHLAEGKTAAAGVTLLRTSPNNTWLSITIHEGRYRQVRRMCQEVGLVVVRLKRVRYGSLNLADLKPGQWRQLSNTEATALI